MFEWLKQRDLFFLFVFVNAQRYMRYQVDFLPVFACKQYQRLFCFFSLSFQEKCYKATSSVDQLAIHFSLDG